MDANRLRAPELRQLDTLLTALLLDAELAGELSLLEKEQLLAVSAVVRSLFAVVDSRDAEESLNES